jgi:hypothetical protein
MGLKEDITKKKKKIKNDVNNIRVFDHKGKEGLDGTRDISDVMYHVIEDIKNGKE